MFGIEIGLSEIKCLLFRLLIKIWIQKKIKDMIWNFIFMSSEFGDDICCYFKVIFGKIKKKMGEVKRKQKIVFIYL